MKSAGVAVLAAVLLALTTTVGSVTAAGAPAAAARAAVQAAVPAQAVVQTAVVGASTARISGANRYEIAVNLSKHRFSDPSRASVVYLVRGDTFGEAAAAGTLTDGPVLLVPPRCGTVPTVVRTEVTRINPARVIALGATTGVCDAALTTAAQGRATSRIAGSSLPDTARLIGLRAFPQGATTAYLTKGSVTTDAVAGGMLRDGPLLYTSTDGQSVPTATLQAIEELGATRVVALGGTSAVSATALQQAAGTRTTGRLSGADQYATSVAIAKHAYRTRTERVYLARGNASSLAVVAAAGVLTDGPVIFTPGTCEKVPGSVGSFLTARTPSRVVALGGTGSLCSSTLVGAAMASRPKPDCAVLKCVALTFDDGPAAPTPTLLTTLATKRVPATFFVVGRNVDANPAPARRAYVEGHSVANHTWDHKQLTTLTAAQQQWQVDATRNELVQHGIAAPTMLRPPYGSYNEATRRLGYPLILWDVDTRDWDGPPSSSTTRQRVVSATTSGSIVLLHDLHWNTVNAVPGIVDDLHARGFTLVTVRELVPTMKAGDLVYRRGTVRSLGTATSSDDVIVTDDGRTLGPVVDEAGIPDLAPSIPLRELLRTDR